MIATLSRWAMPRRHGPVDRVDQVVVHLAAPLQVAGGRRTPCRSPWSRGSSPPARRSRGSPATGGRGCSRSRRAPTVRRARAAPSARALPACRRRPGRCRAATSGSDGSVRPSRDWISTGCIFCNGAPSSSGRDTYSRSSVFALRSKRCTEGDATTGSTATVHRRSSSVRDVMLMSPPSFCCSHARSAPTCGSSAVHSSRRYVTE